MSNMYQIVYNFETDLPYLITLSALHEADFCKQYRHCR